MQGGFDATQVQPQQSVPQHPVGEKFQGTITNTEIKPNKAGDGGFLEVELSSNVGKAYLRYNLWHNTSQQAVEIANKQLSALCHAVNIFRLNYTTDAAELRNARLLFDVAEQFGNRGFVQVTKVYDINGNEPGKVGAGPAQAMPMQQQPQQQPQQASPGAWAAPTAQPGAGGWQPPQQPQQAAPGAWAGQQQQPQAQPGAWPATAPTQPAAQPAAQPGWQPNAPANVPWGQR